MYQVRNYFSQNFEGDRTIKSVHLNTIEANTVTSGTVSAVLFIRARVTAFVTRKVIQYCNFWDCECCVIHTSEGNGICNSKSNTNFVDKWHRCFEIGRLNRLIWKKIEHQIIIWRKRYIITQSWSQESEKASSILCAWL